MASAHDGHRERVKTRFLNEGLDAFEPHQVLEFLLFYAIPYRDTNELAHELINRFGSLSAVFDANIEDLMEIKGIARNSAVLIKMIPELCRVYQKDRWRDRPKISTTAEAVEYLVSLFHGVVEEKFYVLCLDSQNRLIKTEELNSGTMCETSVNPRLLVEVVLRNKAIGIILAHNHPGGNPQASMSDLQSTKKIIDIFRPIGIMVYDHIIVSGSKAFSFSSRGLLSDQWQK